MQKFRFVKSTAEFNMQMKEPHTIIEKWPMKLKLKPGQESAQEEFKLRLASVNHGDERYVEWRRSD